MENIELNIIKGKLGGTVFKYNRFLKLSNGHYLIRNNGCLQLCEIKDSIFLGICSSPKFLYTVLGILELKDKNIMVSGRNFIKIFKINNNKFELIQDFYFDFAELLDIYQLENEKILVNFILRTLYLII